MSPSAYYRLRAAGRGPRETYISAGRIIITPAAEKAWDKARANPSTTEQRLIEKSKAFRLDRAKKAGKAALDSDNHVSKTRRRER